MGTGLSSLVGLAVNPCGCLAGLVFVCLFVILFNNFCFLISLGHGETEEGVDGPECPAASLLGA